MDYSGLWNFVTWIYISLFCECIFRRLVKAIKYRNQDRSKDEDVCDDDKNDELEKITLDTAASKAKSTRGKKKPNVKFNKEAFNRDIGIDKSVFGKKTDLYEIHADAEEPADEDETLKKVTSYYDNSGNLLYKKEKEIPASMPVDAMDSKFHIKPKLSLAKINNNINSLLDNGRKEYAESKVRIDEEVNKTFTDIFGSWPKM